MGERETLPDLTGRTAQCSYRTGGGGCRARATKSASEHRGPAPDGCYGEMGEDGMSTAPSSTDLPFFKHCGPGSEHAEKKCKCGYYKEAHGTEWSGRKGGACVEFTRAGPAEFDEFYCGCLGWS